MTDHALISPRRDMPPSSVDLVTGHVSDARNADPAALLSVHRRRAQRHGCGRCDGASDDLSAAETSLMGIHWQEKGQPPIDPR